MLEELQQCITCFFSWAPPTSSKSDLKMEALVSKLRVFFVGLLNLLLLLKNLKPTKRLKNCSCFYPKAVFAVVQSESISTPIFSCFLIKYLPTCH